MQLYTATCIFCGLSTDWEGDPTKALCSACWDEGYSSRHQARSSLVRRLKIVVLLREGKSTQQVMAELHVSRRGVMRANADRRVMRLLSEKTA